MALEIRARIGFTAARKRRAGLRRRGVGRPWSQGRPAFAHPNVISTTVHRPLASPLAWLVLRSSELTSDRPHRKLSVVYVDIETGRVVQDALNDALLGGRKFQPRRVRLTLGQAVGGLAVLRPCEVRDDRAVRAATNAADSSPATTAEAAKRNLFITCPLGLLKPHAAEIHWCASGHEEGPPLDVKEFVASAVDERHCPLKTRSKARKEPASGDWPSSEPAQGSAASRPRSR